MSEMIERVANAIMQEENPDSLDQYTAMARAAISAMREPTAAMWKAEHPTWSLGRPMWDWWRQMIDEALK